MQPKCIINAKLPDALHLLSVLLVADTHLKIFYNLHVMYFLCTYSFSNYYFSPQVVCSLFKAIFQSRA